jgi:hypothetical protein
MAGAACTRAWYGTIFPSAEEASVRKSTVDAACVYAPTAASFWAKHRQIAPEDGTQRAQAGSSALSAWF